MLPLIYLPGFVTKLKVATGEIWGRVGMVKKRSVFFTVSCSYFWRYIHRGSNLSGRL